LGAGRAADAQEAISLAVERLAGDTAMGKLFKVLGIASAPIPFPGLAPFSAPKETV
jgi:SAM-dependent MidA family methyltransferase